MSYRALKVKLDLNKEQKSRINRLFGCYRLMYNLMLGYWNEYYDLNNKSPDETQLREKLQNLLKDDKYSFIEEFSVNLFMPLLLILKKAFKTYLKRKDKSKGHPKFKSKFDDNSLICYKNLAIYKSNLDNGKISLTKNIKDLKFRTSKEYINLLKLNKGNIKQIIIMHQYYMKLI